MARESKGRFRNFTFLEVFGTESNNDYMVCSECGHGEKTPWIPLLKTGYCPKCGNQNGNKEKVIQLSEEASELMEEIETVRNKFDHGGFIDHRVLRDCENDMRKLENKLAIELRHCEKESFNKGEEN